MNSVQKISLSALVLAFMAGCATAPYQPYAREVKRKPEEGGLIALKTEHRPEDRAKADYIMRSNCGSAQAKVMEEGEVVVGEKTDSVAKEGQDQKEAFTLGGIKFFSNDKENKTTTSSEKTQLKEWQIAYQCITAVQPNAENQNVAKRGKASKKH